MSFKKRTRQNAQQSALVLLISTLIVKIIGAGFKIPLSAKLFLGDLGYGYFSVAYDIFTPFYVLAISGLPAALSHIIAEFVAEKCFLDIKNTFKITKRLFLISGLVLSVIISIFAIPFVKLTDTSGNTLYSVYAVIPSIFLCFVISIYRGYFEGFRNMNPTAISKIIEALGKLFLGLGFAYIANKITGNPALSAGASMLGITIGTLSATLYLYFNYKVNGDLITKEELELSKPSENSQKTYKIILAIAIPIAFSSLISSAVSVIDAVSVRSLLQSDSEFLFENYKGAITSYNGYASTPLEVGDIPTYLYGMRSKAFTMFNLVPTLTMSLGVGALPVLSECCANKDINGIKLNLNTIIKFISLIAFPAGIAYIALARPIMALLYSGFGSITIGGNLLTIFGFTAIFAGFAIPLTSVLQSLNLQLSALWNIVIGVIIKIVLNIALIGNVQFNIYGSAISTTACYLYILLAHLYKISKAIGGFDDVKNTFIKPFITSFVSVGFAFIITKLNEGKTVMVIAILVAVLVYFILVLCFKTLTKSEILNLPKGEKIYFWVNKLKIAP